MSFFGHYRPLVVIEYERDVLWVTAASDEAERLINGGQQDI